MTVRECYDKMNGDYAEAFSRLRTDERIAKFLLRFVDDPSYNNLCDAMAKKDLPEAFRAAHTIKGVCLNLSITQLGRSSEALTEALRNKTEYTSDLDPLLALVKDDYATAIAAIKGLQ